jgi:hypothetical protein
LTGNTDLSAGVTVRFVITDKPTLPGLSVAPMTATVRGAKKGRSGRSSLSTWLGGLTEAAIYTTDCGMRTIAST